MTIIEGFNTPIAIRTLARIEMEPAAHNQNVWAELFVDYDLLPTTSIHDGHVDSVPGDVLLDIEASCRTGRCFAGWALTEAGRPLSWQINDVDPDNRKVTLNADYVADTGESVETAATSLLVAVGNPALPRHHVEPIPALFHQGNTLDDLYVMVADYSGVSHADLRERVQAMIPVLRAEDAERARKARAKVTPRVNV